LAKHEVYNADFEGVFCNAHTRGFRILWDSDIGFGQFDFYIETNNNKLVIENECMSKEFIKDVLNKLVDTAQLDCE
jgi:glycyl-tRNA synthetase beta subunit